MWAFRLLAIKLLIIGLSLCFMPLLLNLVKYLPLVNVLVKSKVAYWACPIFAAVVAMTITFLILTVSWFLYRPMKTLLFTTFFGFGCYLIFLSNVTIATTS